MDGIILQCYTKKTPFHKGGFVTYLYIGWLFFLNFWDQQCAKLLKEINPIHAFTLFS